MDELVITASFNERTIVARAVAVADDPSTVYLVERDGDGAAVVARAVPSFEARWRHGGLRVGRGWVALAASPDGSRVALLGEEGYRQARLQVLERRRNERWEAVVDATDVGALRWIAGGARLLVETRRGVVQVFDARQRTRVDCLAVPGCHAVAADGGSYVRWVTEGADRWLVLVDGATRGEVARWHHGPASDGIAVVRVALTPDGVAWCARTVDGESTLRRLALGEPERRVEVAERLRALFPLAEGAALMTPGGRLGRATVTDAGELSDAWLGPDGGWTDEWYGEENGLSCNGRFAATRFLDGPALLDLATGELTAPADGHAGRVRFLAAAPDGSRVAAVWPHGEVEVLAADSLTPVMAFETDRGPLACAFAPDGREVHLRELSGVASLTIADGSSRRSRPFVSWHTGWGEAGFAVSPDGRLAAVPFQAYVGASSRPTARVMLIELATGATSDIAAGPSEALRHPRFVNGSSDVRGLSEVDGRPAVVTLDAQSGETISAQPLGELLRALPDDPREEARLRLSPDGDVVLARVRHDDHHVLASLPVARGPTVTARVPLGELVGYDDRRLAWLAFSGGSTELLVADAATLSVTARLKLDAGVRVTCACFVAGGAVVLGLDDGRVLRAASR